MSKSPKRCTNCSTERFGIWCRGLCYRCYPLTLEKEKVERWDLKDPATVKGFSGLRSYSQRRLEEEFAKIKAKRLRELNYRLWLLKTKESQRTEEIDGLDIEHALRDLAKACGGKESAVSGIASQVIAHLNQKARRALLCWLLDIEETMRWNPRRYWHALHPEEAQRIVDQNLERARKDWPGAT